MRADDVAEGVELRRRAEGESAEGGLKQQKQRRDERGRHAPSFQPYIQRQASPGNLIDPNMDDAAGKSAKPRCGNTARRVCSYGSVEIQVMPA
ncbi:hypothetical protein MPL3356_310079 [Mesorhizobium plurifarium]|jgi:hypothetical protein|uniref:Uncharacterized protein n=1 Tax=Mesorhizobium plurifarium TaxID=69974 RepID=A0A090DTS9_MESPL|nr:hypothetical protein MPL3356_310079 [Mesorhizobium plurifarium]